MEKKYFAAMVDCSRNGVMKVDQMKKFIDILAAFGYNSLMLYTEDTYEIKEEPFFGYMRGRYSEEELKELDAYGASKGIELIPCIQTLAHLNAIFHWRRYTNELWDTNDILLVDDEKTYEFIEKMFQTCSRCFASKNIHIGMDEAHNVGLGKYLSKHGYTDRFALLKRHLERVIEIAKKYGYTPIMWSDMFFRMANDGIYCLKDKDVIPDVIRQTVPQGVDLTYWNYYNSGKTAKIYDYMIKAHKELNPGCWFAGGAWSWTGFAPNAATALKTLGCAMKYCRKYDINKISVTMWGDNGKECSYFATLPALYYAKKAYDGETSMAVIKEGFKKITGEDFDAMMALELPNLIGDNAKTKYNFNPCKWGLYSDPLGGWLDYLITDNQGSEQYKRYARRLKNLKKKSANYGYVYQTLADLCDVLAVKYELGVNLRAAYRDGDKKRLAELAADMKALDKKLEKFYASFKTEWFIENKPYGFDVHDIRLGGLMLRIKSCRERVLDYVNGKIDKIDELEEAILNDTDFPKGELLNVNNWQKIATVNPV